MNIENKTDNTINKITDTATVEPLTTEEDSLSEDGNYINKLLTTTSSTGFGTKYKIWFQRKSEPTFLNSEYEKGEFLFFDYEREWNYMKKTDFVFEYCYLEHNDNF
ncbi:CNOT3 [Hepatospora eriocheir]|uniref:CNOT3 n=1 Tax=Hepatospora eriocheir TaxID=1081669 RepID=A0A1X0QJQ7_9MICR|nr:CNOT3 [Hepatospora eriocheir]